MITNLLFVNIMKQKYANLDLRGRNGEGMGTTFRRDGKRSIELKSLNKLAQERK